MPNLPRVSKATIRIPCPVVGCGWAGTLDVELIGKADTTEGPVVEVNVNENAKSDLLAEVNHHLKYFHNIYVRGSS